MRAVIQRVSQAGVTIDDRQTATIGRGLLILVGVEQGDTRADVEWLAGKVVQLRIFPDDTGKMNRDVRAVDGNLLVVSQFTLLGDARKGNRPSFVQAAAPEQGNRLYEEYVDGIRRAIGDGRLATGRFGAMMSVEIVNDGPVTIELLAEAEKG